MLSEPTSKQAQRLWPRWFLAGAKPVKADLGPAGACPVVDVGGGGIRVQTLAPLRRGAELPVRIDIPDRPEHVQCSGIVVWSKPNGVAGIRFTNLTESPRKVLHEWLADLEKAATSPGGPQHKGEFNAVLIQIRAAQLNNADALNAIVLRIMEAAYVSGAAIGLGTPENMACVASGGQAPVVGSAIPAVIGITGECVFKRRMVYCQDAKKDPRVGRDLSFGSAVILPLIVNAEVRGILQVFSQRANAFDLPTLDSLEQLADAIVFVTHGLVSQRRLAAAGKPNVQASGNLKSHETEIPGSDHSELKQSAQTPGSVGDPNPLTPASSKKAADLLPLAASWKPSAITRTSGIASVQRTVAQSAAGVSAPKAAADSTIHATVSLTLSPSPKVDAVETVPIATPITSAPLQIARAVAKPAAARTRPRYPNSRRSRRSGKAKWGVAGLALTLLGASAWFYVNNRQARVPVETAANVAPFSEPATKSANIATPFETQMVAKNDLIAAPVSTASPRADIPGAKPGANEQEKRAVEAMSVPQPDPIVLSSSSPRPVRDLVDVPASIATPAPTPVVTSVPQISLPVGSAVPRLAIEPPEVRTPEKLIKKIDPVYPKMARSAGIYGKVELGFRINKDGSVGRVHRITGHPILAGAAMDAIRQWRYEPAKLDGKPIESETTVLLNFDLSR